MQRLYEKLQNIQRSLFCQTNFLRWVFVTRSEYIANNYCEQCSSQNIRSIFIRCSHKDSFSVRVVNWLFAKVFSGQQKLWVNPNKPIILFTCYMQAVQTQVMMSDVYHSLFAYRLPFWNLIEIKKKIPLNNTLKIGKGLDLNHVLNPIYQLT